MHSRGPRRLIWQLLLSDAAANALTSLFMLLRWVLSNLQRFGGLLFLLVVLQDELRAIVIFTLPVVAVARGERVRVALCRHHFLEKGLLRRRLLLFRLPVIFGGLGPDPVREDGLEVWVVLADLVN